MTKLAFTRTIFSFEKTGIFGRTEIRVACRCLMKLTTKTINWKGTWCEKKTQLFSRIHIREKIINVSNKKSFRSPDFDIDSTFFMEFVIVNSKFKNIFWLTHRRMSSHYSAFLKITLASLQKPWPTFPAFVWLYWQMSDVILVWRHSVFYWHYCPETLHDIIWKYMLFTLTIKKYNLDLIMTLPGYMVRSWNHDRKYSGCL